MLIWLGSSVPSLANAVSSVLLGAGATAWAVVLAGVAAAGGNASVSALSSNVRGNGLVVGALGNCSTGAVTGAVSATTGAPSTAAARPPLIRRSIGATAGRGRVFKATLAPILAGWLADCAAAARLTTGSDPRDRIAAASVGAAPVRNSVAPLVTFPVMEGSAAARASSAASRSLLYWP